jgi:dihydroorotase-like cyclic amidohydrolase
LPHDFRQKPVPTFWRHALKRLAFSLAGKHPLAISRDAQPDRAQQRGGGRLTLAEGKLAGADVDMLACVRFVRNELCLPLTEALRMASLYPAQCLGRSDEIGTLAVGARADFIHLSDELDAATAYPAERGSSSR